MSYFRLNVDREKEFISREGPSKVDSWVRTLSDYYSVMWCHLKEEVRGVVEINMLDEIGWEIMLGVIRKGREEEDSKNLCYVGIFTDQIRFPIELVGPYMELIQGPFLGLESDEVEARWIEAIDGTHRLTAYKDSYGEVQVVD